MNSTSDWSIVIAGDTRTGILDSFGRVGVDDLVGAELNALKICSAGRHGRILGQVMVTIGGMRPE